MWVDIGASHDFQEGQITASLAGGAQALAVVRLQGTLYALQDRCSHGPARLSEGMVYQDCIECPLHQGLIDIRTGGPRCPPPVTATVLTFSVREVDHRTPGLSCWLGWYARIIIGDMTGVALVDKSAPYRIILRLAQNQAR